MKRQFPAGYIGSAELLSMLGGESYKKSSLAALVTAGKLPGERTPGGHLIYRKGAALNRAVERLKANPSAQRRVRRASLPAEPDQETRAAHEAFWRSVAAGLCDMHFDGRDFDDLNANEVDALIGKLEQVVQAIKRSRPR